MINVFKAGTGTTSLSLAIINNNSIAVLVPACYNYSNTGVFYHFCILNWQGLLLHE